MDETLTLTYGETIGIQFALRHYAKYFEDVNMHEDAAHFRAIVAKIESQMKPVKIKLAI